MSKDRYLFKAKRIDNGEWVKGSYLYDYGRNIHYIFANEIVCPNCINDCRKEFSLQDYEVDPSTICQCTGLKDKNGNLIWENDIMVAHLDDEYPEDETYIRILWRGSGFCSKENGSEDIAPIDKFGREHFEVCGNIFDNKDLLEKEFFE